MAADCLKLTVYLDEQRRVEGRFVGDALVDCAERHRFTTSILIRGVEGFGLRHRLHSARLENLALDLPLVAVAIDERSRIEAALPEVGALVSDGLVTCERARLLTGDLADAAGELHETTKLTVYVGRGERAGGRPAHLAVVDELRRAGVAGATVLLGVDGTVGGRRARARFFGRNTDVPLMIIAVGRGERIAAALPGLQRLLARPLVTAERVQVCKRDGERLGTPEVLPERDDAGRELWQKLMVYSPGGADPAPAELVGRLRETGAGGATVLRGIWGYSGEHEPHGDRLLALRRRVPAVTVVIDRPERLRRWFAVIDDATRHGGMVTCETVPAYRASSGGVRHGDLALD
jgi:PII-like signaling protein